MQFFAEQSLHNLCSKPGASNLWSKNILMRPKLDSKLQIMKNRYFDHFSIGFWQKVAQNMEKAEKQRIHRKMSDRISHSIQTREPLKKYKIRVARKPDLMGPKSIPFFIFHQTLSDPHSESHSIFMSFNLSDR